MHKFYVTESRLVDTLGLLLALTVTAASVQDRDAAPAVVAQACAKVPRGSRSSMPTLPMAGSAPWSLSRPMA